MLRLGTLEGLRLNHQRQHRHWPKLVHLTHQLLTGMEVVLNHPGAFVQKKQQLSMHIVNYCKVLGMSLVYEDANFMLSMI